MVSRAEFVRVARIATGTPWVHQGRNVPHGVDCIGLILWTLRKLDMNHYEPPPYPRRAKWAQFIPYFRKHLQEISLAEMRAGDVLTFRQDIYPCHCGILTQDGSDPRFIHSYLVRKKVVEERYTAPWPKITVAAFRVPGLD